MTNDYTRQELVSKFEQLTTADILGVGESLKLITTERISWRSPGDDAYFLEEVLIGEIARYVSRSVSTPILPSCMFLLIQTSTLGSLSQF